MRSLRSIAESRQQVDFSGIFHSGGWPNPYQDGTVSGDGSSMHNTRVVRAVLNDLIKVLGIRSLLDVPCGDFHWMRYVNLENVRYLGGDCVNALVESNKSKYAKENVDFKVIDLRGDPLETYDMVLVRDLLIHLSFEEIFAALSNIRLSKSRYLMASTYHYRQNSELPVAFHPINLMAEPFNFPEPAFSFFENISDSPTRCIAVWELAKLPFFYSKIASGS